MMFNNGRRSQGQYHDVLINTLTDVPLMPLLGRFIGPTGDQAALTPTGAAAPIGVVHGGQCLHYSGAVAVSAMTQLMPPYVVAVAILGTTALELGANVTIGQFLTTDPQGLGIVAAPGTPALARALETGLAGTVVEVLLLPAAQ